MSDREIMNAKGFSSKIAAMYELRDPVVKRVMDKFVERSNEGFRKYGTTLHEERTTKLKGLNKYLIDIQEELMDAVLYVQTAREEIKDILDEVSKE
jgi:cyclopropane fatty-acyl-phospholipid synthase-like methyltransferase